MGVSWYLEGASRGNGFLRLEHDVEWNGCGIYDRFVAAITVIQQINNNTALALGSTASAARDAKSYNIRNDGISRRPVHVRNCDTPIIPALVGSDIQYAARR